MIYLDIIKCNNSLLFKMVYITAIIVREITQDTFIAGMLLPKGSFHVRLPKKDEI